jgi:hypothetical protein
MGNYDSIEQAQNLLKYIRTRFFRALVGIVKITQDAPSRVYKLVPLQNFTKESDINWVENIDDIDEQLFKKYKFEREEIEFIKNKIPNMNDFSNSKQSTVR